MWCSEVETLSDISVAVGTNRLSFEPVINATLVEEVLTPRHPLSPFFIFHFIVADRTYFRFSSRSRSSPTFRRFVLE